ncbi:ABC transporter ATP-binding protein [Comamonas composti]|uniref:ABC transporter ATP-binding protein n=1 Tax=Comamonas composti TaxID=408558 RepID=UPI00042A218C|nr:ABC transporter ATP-binding protein [Comamonas composti]
MLELNAVAVRYGHHRALEDVGLQLGQGELVAVLGANGAGKSSLLQCIARLVDPEPGSRLRFDGCDLLRLQPHEVVEAGIALVPEGRGVFGELSVQENLRLGAYARRARASQAQSLARVLALFPRLGQRMAQSVATMSGGEQQMVALGRALMSCPRLLLLDEPSLGLSPLMSGELFKAIVRIKALGVGVLMVEQNARKSLAIAERAYLLGNGRVLGSGAARELALDPAVQAAYLGGGV